MHGVRPVRRFDLDHDGLFDDEVGAMPADYDATIMNRERPVGNVGDLLRVHFKAERRLI